MLDALRQSLNATALDAGESDAAEVADGRLLATLSYVICPMAIVPLLQKRNEYAMFHARQGLGLLCAAIGLSIAQFMLGYIFVVLKISLVATLLSWVVLLIVIGLIVYGAMNAWSGRRRMQPVFGPLADALLQGIDLSPQ